MAPVPFHFTYEIEPHSFSALLRCIWLRLYPYGEDPVYQVYRDQLAESVNEYHAVAYLTATSDIGSSSRSAKGGVASTPELAIQFAAMEAITDLRYHEVQMQVHPGFFHYPTLSPTTGRVIFSPTDPEVDRATGVLSQYMHASYRMIISLSEELNRVQEALAAVSPAPLPVVPPVYSPPVPPPHMFSVPSSSSGPSGISSDSRRETPAEWASLLATPAPPMLRRRASSPAEGETSRQRRRVSFDPATHIISSDSDSGSDDDDSSGEQCPCHRRH